MAKKKLAGKPRIRALKRSEMSPRQAELSDAWRELKMIRSEVYRIVMPNFPAEQVTAWGTGDSKQIDAIEMRADRQWAEAMGVQPLTSLDNLQIVMATVSAAGYPRTDAGLHAWTIAKLKAKPIDLLEATDDDASLDERAVGILYKHKGWTNQQIADEAGCHVKTLNKPNMVQFKVARKALKSMRENYRDDLLQDRRIVTGPDRRQRPSNVNQRSRDSE